MLSYQSPVLTNKYTDETSATASSGGQNNEKRQKNLTTTK